MVCQLRTPLDETAYETLARHVGTWCNLDYALAELWGGKLGRTTTLVEGYDRCNFHFKAVR